MASAVKNLVMVKGDLCISHVGKVISRW